MKNSLLKRAIATASVVPIALTQCLSVASAVNVDYTAPVAASEIGNTSITLDEGNPTSILFIAPEEDYARSGNTFTKSSNWNTKLMNVIAGIAASDKKTGVIDLTELYDTAISKSGEYSEVTKSLIEKLSEITYSVSDKGVITIEFTLDNITPTYTAGGSNTIGGALKDLADEYGVSDLDDPEKFFEDVVIGCGVKIDIDASALANGTITKASLVLTDTATGDVYKGTGAIDWALNGFDILKSTAKDACDKYSKYIDIQDAYNEIDDSVSFYVDKLVLLNDYIDKALNASASISGDDSTDIITAINEKLDAKFGKTLPGSCTAIASNELVQSFYDVVLEQVNDKSAIPFDIEATDFGTLGDELYEISIGVNNGKIVLNAMVEDKEKAAVESYFKTAYPNENVLSIYKTISVTGDVSTITDELGGEAAVDVQIERVVVVEPKTPPTTTTTTTTTTEAPDTTSTTTTVDEPGITSTTTTVDEPGITSTTTTTVDEPGITSTTTTVDEPGITSTTTTVDEPGITSTTTTEKTPGITTTRTEVTKVVKYNADTTVGFYLDIDEAFNLDQIKTLNYSIQEYVVSYGEDGLEISKELVSETPVTDIAGSVEFKDVPADVYSLVTADGTVNQFAAQVQLYASKDIVTADGFVVAKAGEKLTNANGSAVSVTAYVGVKGDANLDMKCDSADASDVLAWYAAMQTGGDAEKVQFSSNTILVKANPVLDDFAAFLADVDNENDSRNYVMLKPERKIDSADASNILAYYSAVMTGEEAGRETWNDVLGEYAKD